MVPWHWDDDGSLHQLQKFVLSSGGTFFDLFSRSTSLSKLTLAFRHHSQIIIVGKLIRRKISRQMLSDFVGRMFLFSFWRVVWWLFVKSVQPLDCRYFQLWQVTRTVWPLSCLDMPDLSLVKWWFLLCLDHTALLKHSAQNRWRFLSEERFSWILLILKIIIAFWFVHYLFM